MQSASASLVAALSRTTRQPSAVVVLHGQTIPEDELESVEVTRTLQRHIPEQATIVSGVTSAQAVVTLIGNAARRFHPFSTEPYVPLLGTIASIQLGAHTTVGLEHVPQMRGIIQSVSAQGTVRQGGRIVITVADFTETLHTAVTLPVVGAGQAINRIARADAPVDSLAAMIACLHGAGRRVSPPFRPQAVWAAPMIGGIVPEVGAIGALAERFPEGFETVAPYYIDGRWGPVSNPARMDDQFDARPMARFPDGRLVTWPTAYAAEAQWMMEAYVDFNSLSGTGNTVIAVYGGGVNGSPLLQWTLIAQFNGAMTVRLQIGNNIREAYAPAFSVRPSGLIYVAAALRWNVNDSFTIACARGNTQFFGLDDGAFTFNEPRPFGHENATIILGTSLKMQQASVSHDPTGGTLFSGVQPRWADPNPSFATTDTFDVTGHRIWQMPAVRDADAWDIIKAIASGAGTTVDWAETGELRIRSYQFMSALSKTPVATYEIERDFVNDGTWNATTAAVRNEVHAKIPVMHYTQGLASEGTNDSQGDPEFTFRWPSVLEIPPGISSHRATANEDRTINIPTQWLRSLGAAGPPPRNTRNVCTIVVGRSANAADPYAGWGRAMVRQLGPAEIELIAFNDMTFPVFAVWPKSWGSQAPPVGSTVNNQPGAPGIVLNGSYLIKRGEISALAFGTSPMPNVPKAALMLADTPWRQDYDHAINLMVDIVNDTRVIGFAATEITLRAGDPRLQVGDVINLTPQANSTAAGAFTFSATIQRTVHGYSLSKGLYTNLTITSKRTLTT